MTPENLQELSTLPKFPGTAVELIRIAGLEAAAALITAWHGQEFPVPLGTRNTESSQRRVDQLVEIVGTEAAAKIIAHWGGQKLTIPTCKHAIWIREQRRICADYDRMTSAEGLSHSAAIFEIGIQTGVSGRCVEIVLRRNA
ncbi:MAG: hypothetical protein HY777_04030 [Betaproteobacteria bacterium]|nr:hypothetical protein [Betaproteobacteria bacterium]